MSKITIVEGNSNDKDNVRAIMVKGEKGEKGDNGEITYSDVVDNLESTSTQYPLSANQGRQLKDLVDNNKYEIDGKITNINYDDKQKVVLYSFFDDINDNLINFYISEDGVNLKQIKTRDKIYGRDPSILYKDGKYYVAVTSYAEDHDFRIYESEDLNNWITHNISVGLYNSEYPKVWCPEWFVDDNDDIYIFIANQYADTEGWGDFELYKTKCTSLENLTFSNATKLILNGATSNNHIDPAVIKYNNLYHMICKSDHQTELYLEHYTSPDLTTWTLIETDPGNFGRDVEAPFIYKLNNEIVIGAERYRELPYYRSFYMVKKTSNFIDYSNRAILLHQDVDVSHGSGTVIEVKTLNKILNSEYNRIEVISSKYLYNENIFDNNYYLVANRTTVNNNDSGEQLGRYLKLFSVISKKNYKYESVVFQLTDVVRGTIDGIYNLICKRSNNEFAEIAFNEVTCTSNARHTQLRSAYASLRAIRNEIDKNMIDVYLDLEQAGLNTANRAFSINIMSFNGYSGEIITYKEKFINTLPETTLKTTCGACNKTRTVSLDNKTNSSVRITFCSFNGYAEIKGELNSRNDTYRIDGVIQLLNQDIKYINKNSNLVDDIEVTLDSHTEDWYGVSKEYVITISSINNYSSLYFILPDAEYNFIKKVEYI